MNPKRRQILRTGLDWAAKGAVLSTAGLTACDAGWSDPPPDKALMGLDWDKLAANGSGFAHEFHERGHLLRQPSSQRPFARVNNTGGHRSSCLILGAGVAGLAAARTLLRQGVPDVCVLDVADTIGGNARAGRLGGLLHPVGAHYLPAPSDDAPRVQELLEDLGLRKRVAGRWQYDEKALCHSPQERLYFQGQWQEGLLPMHGISSQTMAQYQAFAKQIRHWQKVGQGHGLFQMPLRRLGTNRHAHMLDQLHRQSMGQFLAMHGLHDVHLRWYLDYCCRDEYGAGVDVVSAFAGIHYFAARHGFGMELEGEQGQEKDDHAVLTWPQGNAFLTEAMAQDLLQSGPERLRLGRLITQIDVQVKGVDVRAWNFQTGSSERYWAPLAVCALPALLVARVVSKPPTPLSEHIAKMRHSSWTVSNLLLDQAPSMSWQANRGQRWSINGRIHEPLAEQLAWDNVIYGSTSLGYVNAQHQSTDPRTGPTVLTHYTAHGIETPARQRLLTQSWQDTLRAVLLDLQAAHPDLAQHLHAFSVTRHGHAMRVPVAGHNFTQEAQPLMPRMAFAHSDWAGYSVFEEAYEQGIAAAHQVLRWHKGLS